MTAEGGPGPAVDPVLHAIVRSAVEGTGAADGWMVAVDEASDALVVVATAGAAAGRLLGAEVDEGDGFAGFVAASGQPVALEPSADDPRLAEGLAARLGRRPRTLMCVACEDGDVIVGALELVDKDSGRFSVDDLALVGVLADVAGVALRLGAGGPGLLPTPSELGRHLDELARADPVRYAQVAELIMVLVRRD